MRRSILLHFFTGYRAKYFHVLNGFTWDYMGVSSTFEKSAVGHKKLSFFLPLRDTSFFTCFIILFFTQLEIILYYATQEEGRKR